jgi:hypothetical protein
MKSIQLLRNGKNLDNFIAIQTNPGLSDEARKKIIGGEAGGGCDAVCLPKEMCPSYDPCQFGILAVQK